MKRASFCLLRNQADSILQFRESHCDFQPLKVSAQIMHICYACTLVKSWGQSWSSKVAQKERGRLLFPSTCLTLSHLMRIGYRGKGQGWCYSWDSFLVPITQFRASKLRGSPCHSGNNICIYLWQLGRGNIPSTKSNNQSHVSIQFTIKTHFWNTQTLLQHFCY